MWTLSGFADEISPDLETQCSLAAELGLKYIEFRSAWDTNVLDLDDDQLARVRDVLGRHGLQVSSIGSPIGKVFLDDDAEAHLARMRHAADVARLLEAPYVRIFSFFMRPGTDPDTCRDEVLDRMAALAKVAADAGVVLLHENEKGIYGDVPRRCLDIVESVGSPHLALAWDAANFVQVGVRPFTDGYAMLRPHLEYVQIKDAIAGTGQVVPAGHGDGETVETVRALRDDGFDGFFSLEPHLGTGHSFGGFSGPELFTKAWRAFTDILDAEGVPYR
ncbi:sugar phosphate isomerase/epimerase [Isoptericola variabilis]|uniref:Xylose isomerase domain-containing protein TIM barrel n=1 Tax=Isoptericola variabilis (strain 225) TaxID=743718 RepID=F6FT89_ISOV2|nr:sugar phosphate isomerase/epimerase family protein [Isoptericola variabilis]AEG45253.1 Xylose isomerase domain-containing protein TIM barrel [Isoptericola variabilis 225]TWH30954.1 sugar phosphate isomerase/epimerase [Isoptericola variabilis J7]